MRYESLPRKIVNAFKSIFKYMKEEFGNWAYIILGGLIALLYKPILRVLDLASEFILYGVLIFLGLAILYWLFRKIF